MLTPTATLPELQPLWAHLSQHPDKWLQGLLDGLSKGAIPHKYHYDTPKQVDRWLKLHQDYSPAFKAPSVQQIYLDSIRESLLSPDIQKNLPKLIVGIGCGGGWKDRIAIDTIVESGGDPAYLAVDVGGAMTWTAMDHVRPSLTNPQNTAGLSIDLETVSDWGTVFNSWRADEQTAGFTFFGMVPNWEPRTALKGLAHSMRPGDLAWISFNLAPGTDLDVGAEQVFHQYNNQQTECWISSALEDIGFPMDSGKIEWGIHAVKDASVEARKIQADWEFEEDTDWEWSGKLWSWRKGNRIRLFFSCRYTLAQAREMILKESSDWKILNEKTAPNGEEAVFAIQKMEN